MDFGVHNRQRPPAFETAQGQTVYFERLQKELGSHAGAVRAGEIHPQRFLAVSTVRVLSEGRGRIEQVLTPEQRLRFERFLQEQKPSCHP